MLGTLALKPVRQEQNQTARLIPLGFSGNNELIDNDLRAICKIAKLRFPHDKSQRIGNAIPEFVAHYCEFTQKAVNHLEVGLAGIEMFQRYIGFATVVIAKFQMPLRERTSGNILSAQANWRAFENQASERKRLSKAPVNGGAL